MRLTACPGKRIVLHRFCAAQPCIPGQLPLAQDSPFHSELAQLAGEAGVALVLLNAHLPGDDVLEWHGHQGSRRMLGRMLRSYSLIVPRSEVVSWPPDPACRCAA